MLRPETKERVSLDRKSWSTTLATYNAVHLHSAQVNATLVILRREGWLVYWHAI